MSEFSVLFKNKLNGYDKAEVDQFVKTAEAKLQEKAYAMANLQQRVADLEARLARLTQNDTSVEEKVEMYDKLMKKMGRRSGAIGFAVYLDTLERLNDSADRFDVDTVLLYDGTSDLDQISRAVKALTASGKSVTAQRGIPEKLRCREVLILKNGEVATLENNA
jgi:predicted nuclease with TOPRIM domain